MMQEMLRSSSEFSLNFVAMGGRVLATLVFEFGYEQDVFHHGGGVTDHRLFKRVVKLSSLPQAHAFVHKFAAKVQYNGIGCLQFKLVQTDSGRGANKEMQGNSTVERKAKERADLKLKLIEFNTRACGSLAGSGTQRILGYFVRRWIEEHECWHAKSASVFADPGPQGPVVALQAPPNTGSPEGKKPKRFDSETGEPLPKFDPHTGEQNWW